MYRVTQNQNQNQVTFTFQGELVQVKVKHPQLSVMPTRPGGDRRAITSFSPRSRKRLLDTFAQLDFNTHEATFITLTYHNTNPTSHEAKTHLRTFLKRVFRRFGELSVVWRLEPQKRGVWHFHLIVFDLPFYHWKNCLADWQTVTGDNTITNVKLEFCYNAKQVRRYVSKYVAKVADSNLDTAANLAVDLYPGRFWGIENRKNLPFAALVTLVCELGSAFLNFKRSARRFWPGVNKRGDYGFTLYVTNVRRWHSLTRYYLGVNCA